MQGLGRPVLLARLQAEQIDIMTTTAVAIKTTTTKESLQGLKMLPEPDRRRTTARTSRPTLPILTRSGCTPGSLTTIHNPDGGPRGHPPLLRPGDTRQSLQRPLHPAKSAPVKMMTTATGAEEVLPAARATDSPSVHRRPLPQDPEASRMNPRPLRRLEITTPCHLGLSTRRPLHNLRLRLHHPAFQMWVGFLSRCRPSPKVSLNLRQP